LTKVGSQIGRSGHCFDFVRCTKRPEFGGSVKKMFAGFRIYFNRVESGHACMNKLPLNVWLLAVSQALVMSVASLVILVGGLVGATIAPSPNLATLPVASLTVGTAALVIPVAMLMKKFGRKLGILTILAFSATNSMLAFLSIEAGNFYLFCFSVS